MGSKTRGCVSSHRQLHRPARCVPLAQSPSCSGPCRAAKEKLAAITPALLLCGAGQNFIVHLKKQQQQQKKNNPKPATGCRARGASTPKPPRSRSLGTGWHAGPQPELMAFPPPAPWHFPLWRRDSNTNWVLLLKLQLVRCFLAGFCPAVLPAKYRQRLCCAQPQVSVLRGSGLGSSSPPVMGSAGDARPGVKSLLFWTRCCQENRSENQSELLN